MDQMIKKKKDNKNIYNINSSNHTFLLCFTGFAFTSMTNSKDNKKESKLTELTFQD